MAVRCSADSVSSFANFRILIAEINGVIGDLPCSDPASRMSARVALERPVAVIYIISLASLLIQLKVIRSEY